jgi:signal transduction histidine kinase
MLFVNKDPFKKIFGNAFSLEIEDWSLNKFTLSFTGPAKKLEKTFHETFYKNSIVPFRLSILLGTAIYALFYTLDITLFPDLEKEFFIIRFEFVIPIMVTFFLLSFTDIFRRYMQFIASLGMFITSFGIVLMVVITAETANNYSYYAGIILILFFSYTIVRIRFIYAFVTGWLVMLSYEIAAVFFTDTPPHVLLNNNFFFVSSNLVGMLISYYLEYNDRWNFFLQINLKQERQKVFEANEKLEERVRERTRELVAANKKLNREIKQRDLYKNEKAKLETQLFQLQKMETIGTLAGGIAHDCNNILTPILGYSGMMLDDLEPDSELRDDILQIQLAAQRGKDLVQKVLTFSRHIKAEMKPVQLNEIISEAIDLLKVSFPENINLKTDFAGNTGPVMGDRSQIHQVAINLIINAIHAMKNNGGRLEIKINSEYVSKKQTIPVRKIKEGHFVVLTISDTGIGMNSKTLSRIFEPFFTNKEVGEGTGLGLAVVHGIVNNHKGFIDVVSKPNEGSTFRIYFPEHKNERNAATNGMLMVK